MSSEMATTIPLTSKSRSDLDASARSAWANDGADPESLRHAFLDHLRYSRGKNPENATTYDRFNALALTVRDRLANRWVHTQRAYYQKDVKRAYYLSAEYLLGRVLENNLLNLGLLEEARAVLQSEGVDLDALLETEPDPGLGNGGLGRLAACFLDSMATLGLPGFGYGIRYEFGIFTQDIVAGHQVERADEWLKFGNPWEIVRPERAVAVRFYGRVEHEVGADGLPLSRWVDSRTVLRVPYDVPIAGYGLHTVNTLRLWQARASEEFDLRVFNDGDYERSVVEKNASEVISKVLYPNDNFLAGKELRLKQQYFFTACSIADIVRRFLKTHSDFRDFPSRVAIQLNDTHPAISVVELMRVLVDEKEVPWETAWEITVSVFGYTNHTLLPEALERWPVNLFERLLPRHLEIIYEINSRFLRQAAARYAADPDKLERLSIFEEGPEKHLRMTNLAVVASHSINGVAELHTELLRRTVLRDFAELFPERFNNKTNGVTPRRWLAFCNPRLAKLISSRIGERWITDLSRLRELEPLVEDPQFVADFRAVKRANKEQLAAYVRDQQWLSLKPDAIFDVQIKRLHEYKRQLLNAIHVVSLWIRAKQEPASIFHPRAFIFGGKAAPGYHNAKLIIRLINGIAQVVNGDSENTGIQAVFLPNYRVSLAERIFPAADVSEQISTAGKEASGTGNMKFALNGALTVGTLDGANIEIRDAVGHENFFLFGLDAQQVQLRRSTGYRPGEIYEAEPLLKQALDLIASGFFSPEDPRLFQPLIDSLLNEDPYFCLADFASYARTQEQAARAYLDGDGWAKKAILNVSRVGQFSSDRTIRQYADEIWNICPVELPP